MATQQSSGVVIENGFQHSIETLEKVTKPL